MPFSRFDRATGLGSTGNVVKFMARGNGICHVPFRENPNFDPTKSPSLACVERRLSGPNTINRSAANIKFVKSCATCHKHVSSGPMNIAIDHIILLSSVRGEQNLSGPNSFSRSRRSKRVQTRATCHWCHVP